MGYTKLFSSLIHSTVWREPDHTRLLWITMLALADRDGRVDASVPGLADAARVTLEQCQEALLTLSSPDLYSRTPDYSGRRIEAVDGGWRLLNYDKYREKMSKEEQREKARERVARHRRRKRNADVTASNACNVCNANETEANACNDIAEAKAEAEAKEGDDARDPTTPTIEPEQPYDPPPPPPPPPTPTSEARELERNRRKPKSTPHQPHDGPPVIVDCLECGKPMKLVRGQQGAFYAHPHGTALGCAEKYEAEFYEAAKAEKAAGLPVKPDRYHPKDTVICPTCGEQEAPHGEQCPGCRHRALEAAGYLPDEEVAQ